MVCTSYYKTTSFFLQRSTEWGHRTTYFETRHLEIILRCFDNDSAAQPAVFPYDNRT